MDVHVTISDEQSRDLLGGWRYWHDLVLPHGLGCHLPTRERTDGNRGPDVFQFPGSSCEHIPSGIRVVTEHACSFMAARSVSSYRVQHTYFSHPDSIHGSLQALTKSHMCPPSTVSHQVFLLALRKANPIKIFDNGNLLLSAVCAALGVHLSILPLPSRRPVLASPHFTSLPAARRHLCLHLSVTSARRWHDDWESRARLSGRLPASTNTASSPASSSILFPLQTLSFRQSQFVLSSLPFSRRHIQSAFTVRVLSFLSLTLTLKSPLAPFQRHSFRPSGLLLLASHVSVLPSVISLP